MNEEIHEAELEELSLVLKDANALAVADGSGMDEALQKRLAEHWLAVRARIVEILRPVVDMLPEYEAFGLAVKVANAVEAESAGNKREAMLKCIEIVQQAIKPHKEAAHRVHKGWTKLESRIVDVLETAARQTKQAQIGWQEAEAEAARKKQAEIQARLDAEAAAERQRLLKLAEKRKTPEVKERYAAEAQRVVAPIAHVAAPEKVVSSRKVWKATVTDMGKLIAAVHANKQLRSYLQVDLSALQRTKSANKLFEVDGIEFRQISV